MMKVTVLAPCVLQHDTRLIMKLRGHYFLAGVTTLLGTQVVRHDGGLRLTVKWISS